MTSDPLAPHSHEPNPRPPTPDPTLILSLPGGSGERPVTVAALDALPTTAVPGCFIVSTGHGTSGPFTFSGVLLADLLAAYLPAQAHWSQIEVISGDGFGTRVQRRELSQAGRAGQILLATAVDGVPLTRARGLVRLIVPGERDDALRQVKWVGRINVR